MTKKPSTLSVIMKRESKAYFTSPVAYIVTCLFLIINGVLFFSLFFVQNRADLRAYFANLPLFLSFFVPALTMKIFAEERRSGSMETLMTLPVTEWDVVTGKYLASFFGTLLMIAPTLLYVITLVIFGSPDAGPVIGGYAGAVFLSAVYTAIGCFSSSITKNQIIAFFTGLAICLGLTLCDIFVIILPPSLVSFVSYISFRAHFDSIAKGILDTRDIIYFLSVTALFFVMTVKVQKQTKNRG